MKSCKSLWQTAVSIALTGGVIVSIAAMEMGKNKEKEIYADEDMIISKKGDTVYMTENTPDGPGTKMVVNDQNGDGTVDSADLGSSVDIKILLNGFTDEKDDVYYSVKDFIEMLNDQGINVDYSSFKHLTNHIFDVVKVVDNRRLVDPNDRNHSLNYTVEFYYNGKLIYAQEHQFVSLDKDGNKVFLKYLSSKDSIESQGIDIENAEEFISNEEISIPTIKK